MHRRCKLLLFLAFTVFAAPLSGQTEVDIAGEWICSGSAKFVDGSTQTAESTLVYTSAGENRYEWTMSATAVQKAPKGYRYPSVGRNTNTVSYSSEGFAELDGSELEWWVGSAEESGGAALEYGNVHGISRASQDRIESVSASGNPQIVSSSSSCTRIRNELG